MVEKLWQQEHEEDSHIAPILKKQAERCMQGFFRLPYAPPFILGRSSVFHYMSLKMPSWTCPENRLLDGPKSSQVDHED